MQQPRVTRTQAIGLEEIGFDEVTDNVYHTKSDGHSQKGWGGETRNSNLTDFVTAPTLDEAIRWMREVKNVHVCVTLTNKNKWVSYLEYTKTGEFDESCGHCFTHHDQAQSAGLDAAIEYLKNQAK